MSKVEVTKLTILLNGKRHTVSVEDARALQDQLNKLFGQPQQVVVQPPPIIIERKDWPYWDRPWRRDIWCSDTGTSITVDKSGGPPMLCCVDTQD